jgi:primosomal protein N' (replication factor Y)
LDLHIGQAVWVPFGNKVLQGIVLELGQYPSVEETKEIAAVIEPRLVVSPARLALARWLSEYYLSPTFDAVALMLPPGFERKTLTFVSITGKEYDLSRLTPEQQQVIKLANKQGRVSLRQLERALGKKKAQAAVSQLATRGLLARSYEPEPVRIKPREELYLGLAVAADSARREAAGLRNRAPKQAALLEFLIRSQPVSLAAARSSTGCQLATARALEGKGLVTIKSVEVKRQPISYQGIEPEQPLNLTPAQKSALDSITTGLRKGQSDVFLLHGVTGSGKTEVYLQALAEARKQGQRGIVLVPEIALTPQTIDRFAARFPGRVAVLHSRLSPGEQFDQWRQIRDGEFDVVIGARSAIFAPQPNLGLIVVDEEHEWAYKQDTSPRYHAREVTLKLAELSGAVVILGSATPDVVTFYHARRGDYHLLKLPERVTPNAGSALPEVSLVDLKEELKAGSSSIFSRRLKTEIDNAITNREQVILFFNRRGAATFIQCRDCGFVLRCRRCQVPLSYHSYEDTLICHQCHYRTAVAQTCPRCHSHRIKFFGIGTQKLEQAAAAAFPRARLLRWDSDATRGKGDHRRILDRFRAHDADILIGTQMVAKGLDLPGVTLVGVVSADTALNLPDFRAGERTFQLLAQVAGRAGRGPMGGRVVIQTYSPQNYAIQAAVKHDYISFYNQEIAYRRQLHNPPFSRLARLTYSHLNDARCQQEATIMKRLLALEKETAGAYDISLIGPAPAFIHRLRGRFRWQLIIRGARPADFLSRVAIPHGWAVDIDPVGL